jgi:hypothetical protein
VDAATGEHFQRRNADEDDVLFVFLAPENRFEFLFGVALETFGEVVRDRDIEAPGPMPELVACIFFPRQQFGLFDLGRI